jgi:ubiquitin-conjugating enzyme E2 J2
MRVASFPSRKLMLGGQYMGLWPVLYAKVAGTLKFPPEYPFKPPAVTMITPSGTEFYITSLSTGRFQPNTRLCFSFSDFHPKEWNPSWQVSTILVGLLSFMVSL